MESKQTKLSLVVSVYNEEAVLELFWSTTDKYLQALKINYEIIFVNDGSRDQSLQILKKLTDQDKHIKVINFSRNYGHEAAMIAGIDHAVGEAVICMDCDLQHPPEKIKAMLRCFDQGYEVINMMRTDRRDHNFVMKFFSFMFYRFLNRLSSERFEPNASDFFLISKRVAHILKKDFRERTRFLRGFIQIVGFKNMILPFVAPPRAGGESKYSLTKLIKLSISSITTFSNIPLALGIFCGIFMGGLTFLIGIIALILRISGHVLPGYTGIILLIAFCFSLQFFIIGIIGQYLAYIFEENKKRPLYIVKDIIQQRKPEKEPYEPDYQC